MANSEEDLTLSEPEGALLNVIRLNEPVTAYKTAQIYGKDPSASFDKSKGRIYPMIRKFNRLRLIEGKFVEGDGRGTEVWCCTSKGNEALHGWVMGIRDEHMFLDDPIRSRLLLLDLLSEREKFDWVLDAKERIAKKIEEVDAYDQEGEIPFHQFVQEYSLSTLRTRMDWLDKLLFALNRGDFSHANDTAINIPAEAKRS